MVFQAGSGEGRQQRRSGGDGAGLLGALFVAIGIMCHPAGAAPDPAAAPFPTEPSAAPALPAAGLIKIILVGDSTMAPHTGWGGEFCGKHVTTRVACLTMGQGGRSTKTYRSDGFWQQAMAEARIEGYRERYVLIQLGQNDTFNDQTIGTDLTTEYPRNLEAFIDEARSAGCRVVLLTPVAGRRFIRHELLNNIGNWAAQMRAVAALKNVPLVDVNAASAELFSTMGPVKTLDFELSAPTEMEIREAETGTSGPQFKPSAATPQPDGPTYHADYIHLNRNGAEVVARLVAQGLLGAIPELKGMVLE